MEVAERQDFDLEVVLEGFKRCHSPDGTLLLEHYLAAFSELCRFLRLLGRLFGFVAKDLQSNTDILETHRQTSPTEKYHDIQYMIEYEVRENLTRVQVSGSPSGSRTLLRLHRALEFMLTFMECLANSPEDASASHIAADAYKETLSKHHPWLVRKMSLLAVYTLPSRNKLIRIMHKCNTERTIQLINECVTASRPVYDIVQELLVHHNLLHLP